MEPFVQMIFEILLVSNPHKKVHVIINQELKIYSFGEQLITFFCEVGVLFFELLALLFAFCLRDVVLHMVKDVYVFNVLHPKDCQLQNRHLKEFSFQLIVRLFRIDVVMQISFLNVLQLSGRLFDDINLPVIRDLKGVTILFALARKVYTVDQDSILLVDIVLVVRLMHAYNTGERFLSWARFYNASGSFCKETFLLHSGNDIDGVWRFTFGLSVINSFVISLLLGFICLDGGVEIISVHLPTVQVDSSLVQIRQDQ